MKKTTMKILKKTTYITDDSFEVLSMGSHRFQRSAISLDGFHLQMELK